MKFPPLPIETQIEISSLHAENKRLRAELAAERERTEPADDWEARQHVAEAVAAERERCAKIAERYCDSYDGNWAAEQIVAAIRRGEP